MKKFIIDIFLGLLSFCLIWLPFEYTIAHLGVSNNYSYKYNYTKDNPHIKTLFIGSSHFENGVNPYLLGDSVFDFAIGGRVWMYWDAVLMERLIPTLPNLKNVVFPLGYESAYVSPHYQPNYLEHVKDPIYMYTKYMDVPFDRTPQKYKYYSALLNNKMGLKYWIDEKVDSLGYAPRFGQMSNWKELHNMATDIDSEVSKLCFDENRRYLMKIAMVCKENNIRLIVVTSPCANCYVQNTNSQGVKNLYDMIDSIAAYYPIEYYNYLNDAEFREDSIYYNSSHLNSFGADFFARRLKKDMGL